MNRACSIVLYFLWLSTSSLVAFAQSGTITTYAGAPLPVVDESLAITQTTPLPTSIVSDGAGGFYFVGSAARRVYRVTANGVIRTVAGNGAYGFSGDGGPATSATLSGPAGLAVDAAGNLFIADNFNMRVRRVTPDGIITTIAGNGTFGTAGDGGPAVSAELATPRGLAVDVAGNLLIADEGGYNVRKVTPSGMISTVAGNGSRGFSGDGGPATSAQLAPDAVAVDAMGNLFIGEFLNNRIRKVNTAGVISTFAGNGGAGFSGDGGPANFAQLNFPAGISVDSAGNLFIGDLVNNRIRKVTPSGMISTVAGNGSSGFSGDGGPATSAQLSISPESLRDGNVVAVDAAGNLFISDIYNGRIRKVTPNGIINTVAGAGVAKFGGDGGPANRALLNRPTGVALDAAGNLFISDADNYRVRRISPDGVISTVAGDGKSGYGGDGVPATAARLGHPEGLAVDTAGNLYIADSANHMILKVTPDGVIRRIAGVGNRGYDGEGLPGTSSRIQNPSGIAVDAAGNVFFTTQGFNVSEENYHVRKITPDGLVWTVAGDGNRGFGGDGGPAISASLDPAALALDAAGNLYIADYINNRIRRVSPGGVISTVAGNGTAGFGGDGGPATAAQLKYPTGVAVDAAGSLYIADWGNNRIRKVTRSGLITTIAGDGTAGFSGDGGPAPAAQLSLYFRSQLAVSNAGSIFIADLGNNRIRQVRRQSTHDFNGDGASDVLWRDTAGNVSMWLLHGTTIANNSFIASIWPGWSIAGVGDFNGDGKADVLWREIGGDVSMWLMDGSSVVSYQRLGNIWSGWSLEEVGDFNGDGKADILWREPGGDMSMWLMDGFSVTKNMRLGNAPREWTIVGNGDFNGDGKADILWRAATGEAAVWLMDGFSVVSATTLGVAPPTLAGIGDFNDDGRADILWRDNSGSVFIWFMNGSTIVNNAFVTTISTGWTIASLGDFNGDGVADLLCRDATGEVSIWLMDGSTLSRIASMGNVSDKRPQR